jgi:hypothetical protein
MIITAAFEELLCAEYVPWWDDQDGASLSPSFVFAFGAELTPRLDLAHQIRSRALPAAELAWLRGLPSTLVGVEQFKALLHQYQAPATGSPAAVPVG